MEMYFKLILTMHIVCHFILLKNHQVSIDLSDWIPVLHLMAEADPAAQTLHLLSTQVEVKYAVAI
jgi:hypothetical protein